MQSTTGRQFNTRSTAVFFRGLAGNGAAGVRLTALCMLLAGAALSAWSGTTLQAAIKVTDDAGRSVELQQPARRIVSLAPHLTELLFAAGAGDVVVGVSEFSDYPSAANAITRVGGGGGLDLEAIVALQPDLVVAWQSGNPASQLQRLQALGLTLFMSEPRRLEDVTSTLQRFGELAGTTATAAVSIDEFRQRHKILQQRYAARTPVSVFYQIWDRPLMTLSGEHLFSDVLHLCGGRNVFDGLPALAPQIDVEAVLSLDPDVIIVAAESDSPLLSAWRQWPSLSAVQGGHIYAMGRDQLVRHSPRILDGAQKLCELLEDVRKEQSSQLD